MAKNRVAECSRCHERRKIIAESLEAYFRGDTARSKEKLDEAFQSAKSDFENMIKNMRAGGNR